MMSYQSEKFSVARACLMLPHPQGEDASIAEAMFNIDLALDRYEVPSDFNEDAAGQLAELRRLMDRGGLEDSDKIGLYKVLAHTWGVDEQHRFSHLVDELAWWFSEYDRRNA
ncbi:hypothetical protein [Stenotrophomonas sp.]|uniref:hypothetical protein n=1 Tax=Stenotrophomonas sp. TaxID=69392 RepID=UPI0028ACA76E|nr:hypothetical protein [Stenotrophomonas sp.]